VGRLPRARNQETKTSWTGVKLSETNTEVSWADLDVHYSSPIYPVDFNPTKVVWPQKDTRRRKKRLRKKLEKKRAKREADLQKFYDRFFKIVSKRIRDQFYEAIGLEDLETTFPRRPNSTNGFS
jgi:hypothetical protein